jgi:hypothetical protein
MQNNAGVSLVAASGGACDSTPDGLPGVDPRKPLVSGVELHAEGVAGREPPG